VFVIREAFAESIAERRRAHRTCEGVVLVTAHKAKGLEFPHVFIADGGWQFERSRARMEEERRTYYVAMTRAQETLTLLSRRDCRNPFMSDIAGEHVIDRAFRAESGNGAVDGFQYRRYATLSPTDLFVSYAETFANGSPARKALQDAQVDDPVSLVVRGPQIRLETAAGLPIGQLSEAGKRAWRDRLTDILSARLIALVHRHSGEDPKPRSPEEPIVHWEYPLVEVTWIASRNGMSTEPQGSV
jgi:ATP-dependent DNA helicase RecQ